MGVLDYNEFLRVGDALVRLAEQKFGDFYYFDIIMSPQQVEQELLRVDEDINPNHIILLTVLNTTLLPINVNTIASICSTFGEMLRIVVERRFSCVPFRTKVEFENVEVATRAKNSLHGFDIYTGTNTMKVEFARTNKLAVYENNDRTWDFTEEFFLQGGKCRSSVCLVYGLKPNKFNCQRLFNIFLQFGIINRIVFPKNQEGMAMIEMDSSESVDRAVQNLNYTIIFGSMLRIVWSYIQHICGSDVTFDDLTGKRLILCSSLMNLLLSCV